MSQLSENLLKTKHELREFKYSDDATFRAKEIYRLKDLISFNDGMFKA